MTSAQHRRGLAWWAGLVVAVGAAVATAHGLYEVAVAARQPFLIACIYPLITDGLALVAYAATISLRSSVGYAWCVVMGAALLSGTAQAVYLAGEGFGLAPPALRGAIGMWPAVAFAVTFHLLYLLGRVEGDTPVVSHALGVPERLTDVPERVTAGPSPVRERSEPAPKHAAKTAPAQATKGDLTVADVLAADETAGERLGVRRLAPALGISEYRAEPLRKEADRMQEEMAALMASSVPIHHVNGSNHG